MQNVNLINSFTKSQLEAFLENDSSIQKKSAIASLKKVLDDAYYNGTSLTNDWRYDMIKDKVFNDHSVGAPLHSEEVKVQLPVWLGSLDKIKPENTKEIEKWKSKYGNQVLAMDKLDGISCLYAVNKATNQVSLYTRGDGQVGKDISYILEYIQGIPRFVNVEQSNFFVRGELVIPKKYNIECSRNIVSGAVKGKKVTKYLNKIVFVAHEFITTTSAGSSLYTFLDPRQQLEFLTKSNFQVVHSQMTSISELSDTLKIRLQQSEYDIDGIVVHSLHQHARNESGNPDYSFAYKEDTFYKTHVRDVTWSVSKSRLLKPVVVIDPVNILGANVTCASGYNAKFIFDNKIGKNAVVTITRSGEVIPKIVDVITPSAEHELVYPKEKCVWNETKVELVLSDENADTNEELKIKKLVHFANVMDVQHLGPSTAKKLVDANIDTVQKLLLATRKDFEKLASFKDLSVERLFTNVHTSWNASSLAMKMHASSCFPDGLGLKNFETILRNPRVLQEETHKKSVQKYLEGYPVFKEFMSKLGIESTLDQPSRSSVKSLPSNLPKIVFSGFRDASLEKKVEECGVGQMTSTISGKTNLLVVDSLSSKSSKIIKAKELGIKIVEKSEFVKIYNL